MFEHLLNIKTRILSSILNFLLRDVRDSKIRFDQIIERDNFILINEISINYQILKNIFPNYHLINGHFILRNIKINLSTNWRQLLNILDTLKEPISVEIEQINLKLELRQNLDSSDEVVNSNENRNNIELNYLDKHYDEIYEHNEGLDFLKNNVENIVRHCFFNIHNINIDLEIDKCDNVEKYNLMFNNAIFFNCFNDDNTLFQQFQGAEYYYILNTSNNLIKNGKQFSLFPFHHIYFEYGELKNNNKNLIKLDKCFILINILLFVLNQYVNNLDDIHSSIDKCNMFIIIDKTTVFWEFLDSNFITDIISLFANNKKDKVTKVPKRSNSNTNQFLYFIKLANIDLINNEIESTINLLNLVYHNFKYYMANISVNNILKVHSGVFLHHNKKLVILDETILQISSNFQISIPNLNITTTILITEEMLNKYYKLGLFYYNLIYESLNSNASITPFVLKILNFKLSSVLQIKNEQLLIVLDLIYLELKQSIKKFDYSVNDLKIKLGSKANGYSKTLGNINIKPIMLSKSSNTQSQYNTKSKFPAIYGSINNKHKYKKVTVSWLKYPIIWNPGNIRYKWLKDWDNVSQYVYPNTHNIINISSLSIIYPISNILDTAKTIINILETIYPLFSNEFNVIGEIYESVINNESVINDESPIRKFNTIVKLHHFEYLMDDIIINIWNTRYSVNDNYLFLDKGHIHFASINTKFIDFNNFKFISKIDKFGNLSYQYDVNHLEINILNNNEWYNLINCFIVRYLEIYIGIKKLLDKAYLIFNNSIIINNFRNTGENRRMNNNNGFYTDFDSYSNGSNLYYFGIESLNINIILSNEYCIEYSVCTIIHTYGIDSDEKHFDLVNPDIYFISDNNIKISNLSSVISLSNLIIYQYYQVTNNIHKSWTLVNVNKSKITINLDIFIKIYTILQGHIGKLITNWLSLYDLLKKQLNDQTIQTTLKCGEITPEINNPINNTDNNFISPIRDFGIVWDYFKNINELMWNKPKYNLKLLTSRIIFKLDKLEVMLNLESINYKIKTDISNIFLIKDIYINPSIEDTISVSIGVPKIEIFYQNARKVIVDKIQKKQKYTNVYNIILDNTGIYDNGLSILIHKRSQWIFEYNVEICLGNMEIWLHHPFIIAINVYLDNISNFFPSIKQLPPLNTLQNVVRQEDMVGHVDVLSNTFINKLKIYPVNLVVNYHIPLIPLIKIGKVISLPLIDRLELQFDEVTLLGINNINKIGPLYYERVLRHIKKQYGIGIISYAQPFKSIFNLSMNTINVIWKPGKKLYNHQPNQTLIEFTKALNVWYDNVKEDVFRIKRLAKKVGKNINEFNMNIEQDSNTE